MIQQFPKEWPTDYRLPIATYPNAWSRGPVSGGGALSGFGDLGCNCAGNSTNAAQTSGLGAMDGCPSTANIVVEDNSVPQWVWWVAAIWGGLMLFKRGGR